VTTGGYAANAKGPIAFLPLVETLITILPLIFQLYGFIQQNRNLHLCLLVGCTSMSRMDWSRLVVSVCPLEAKPNQRYAKRVSILVFAWLMENAWWVCMLSFPTGLSIFDIHLYHARYRHES
jgi:hypothetical protein